MTQTQMRAGLGAALVATGLGLFWRESHGPLWVFAAGDWLFFSAWFGPAGAVVAAILWPAALRRRGAARFVYLAAAVAFGMLALIALGARIYFHLFPIGRGGAFEPIAPDPGEIYWVVGGPALVGGLWLLLTAARRKPRPEPS